MSRLLGKHEVSINDRTHTLRMFVDEMAEAVKGAALAGCCPASKECGFQNLERWLKKVRMTLWREGRTLDAVHVLDHEHGDIEF